MEAEIIKNFLPDLVTAISDNIQSVSDQCLAKGLIAKQVHERLFESGGTSKDRARTLLLAVQNSTETDSRCLEIFLSILDEVLPRASREKLLSEIRKEVTEKVNTCKAVVPSAQANQQLQPGELAKESALQQSSLLGRFEDSIRQHERACAEKKLLEERLKVKSEKCKTLKVELETLRGQNQEVANTQSRISACTIQIENLKKRTEELQKTIEEQGMQAKRDRNTVITQTKKLFDNLVQQSQLEIQKREKEAVAARKLIQQSQLEIQRREEELMARLRENEASASKKTGRGRKVRSKQGNQSPPPPVATPVARPVATPLDVLRQYHLVHLCNSMLSPDAKVDKLKFSEWKSFGLHLGLTIEEMGHMIYIVESCMAHTYDFVTRIMEKWLQKSVEGNRNPPTYSHLKSALENAGLREEADKLISYDKLPQYN